MELFEHQKVGVAFLKDSKRAILADEMGLGKTVQAIVASEGNTLILCPASLKTNWAREIEQVEVDPNIEIMNGANLENYRRGSKQFLIANYDLADRYLPKLQNFFAETVIADEAHYIKNTTSKRSKAALALCDKADRVYLLTGTPVANRPIEYFNLLRAIKHPLAANYFAYAKRYCGAFMQELGRSGKRFLNVSGATNLIELHDRTKASMLRRTKDKVTNLPPKIRAIVPVEMDEAHRKQYARAWDDYLNFFNETVTPDMFESYEEYEQKKQNVELAKHMIELQKLKQITSLAKLDRLMEDIKNIIGQENKLIVFTQYKETLHQIADRLFKEGIGYTVLEGDTTQAMRQEAVDEFQNIDRVKVFLGSIKACGFGITLTKASIVIFADLDWTVTSHDQAEDRAHRIGQTGTVNVYYYVIKNTVEDRIIRLLTAKRQTIAQVVEGKVNTVKNVSVAGDLLKELYENRR